MNKTYCIIGTSAAGIAAAQKLRQLDSDTSIICISDENEMPYNKCMLADYVSGLKDITAVHTLSPEQATQKNITLLLGKKVVVIDPAKKTITLHDNQTIVYHALLLAVGTHPLIPPIGGVHMPGVFTFHRLSDINAIMQYVQQYGVKKVVVIGSGLSGLECADALMAKDICVALVERNKNVLSSLVNEQGSVHIQAKFIAQGGHLYTQCNVQEIIAYDGHIQGVLLSEGPILNAQMIIIAVGIQPNLSLAQQAGLQLYQNIGIAVNDYMQTSQESIYAAGDIVAVKNQITNTVMPSRTWPDAMLQGITAAHAMVGQTKTYPGLATVISSSFFGIKFARFGILEPRSETDEIVDIEGDDFYHRFIINDSQLKGFLLVGNTAQMGKFRMAMLTRSLVNREFLTQLSKQPHSGPQTH